MSMDILDFVLGQRKKEEASLYIARGENRINMLMKTKQNLGLLIRLLSWFSDRDE